jgi:hypothetical protein
LTPAAATTFTINNLSTNGAELFEASVSGTFDYSAGVYSNIDILVTIPSLPGEQFNDGSTVSQETASVLDLLNLYYYDPFQEILWKPISLDFANSLDNYTCPSCGGTNPILVRSFYWGPESASGIYAGENYFLPGGYVSGGLVAPAVPESSTWAMMLLGFAGLGFAGYRRAKRSDATFAAA